MNFSNDLEYSVKKAQARKAENKGTKKVEEFSEQARRETGLEEVEEHNKKLRITSLLKRKNEIKNKEEADFNEDDEVFQDNDDNDKVQEGLDFIPDDESGDEGLDLNKEKNANKKIKFTHKNTNLDEEGEKLLKVRI